MLNPPALCVHCQQPIIINQAYVHVFEGMHWLCFHLVFEHNADPDEACQDPGCPWWHIAVFRAKLEQLGHDPGEVLDHAIRERWNNPY